MSLPGLWGSADVDLHDRPLMVHRRYWLIIALGVALAWQPSDGSLALPAWLTGEASDLAPANAGVHRVRLRDAIMQPSTQEPPL